MRAIRLIIGLVLLSVSQPSWALVGEAWDYIKQYQLGVDYTNSYNQVDATYDTAKTSPLPPRCEDISGSSTKERCSVSMDGGHSSGYGLVLQQAFKRQGLYYFKPDIGFGVRYLNGSLSERDREQQLANHLPLDEMSFSLLAVVMKPSLTFGITPASRWPDLLLTLGPALQVATGRVSVNNKAENVAVATSSGLLSGFLELELVFWRFGDGALSVFSSHEYTGSGRGSKFYPKSVDGMDEIHANFSQSVNGGFYGFGIKLLFNWP